MAAQRGLTAPTLSLGANGGARPAADAAAITPELLQAVAARAGRHDYPRFEAQLRSSGYCARPVRLQGHVEVRDGGRRRRVWSTDANPTRSCARRAATAREAVCAPCAERYRQDAYHLIAAGL